jgi:hypothetical protein
MSSAENEICVWILGLIHSGTTIFWRAWRKDPRFLCFDEPFSGIWGTVLAGDSKASSTEFIDLLKREEDPRAFWEQYAPLHPLEELDAAFTAEQSAYLRYLVAQSPKLVIDETHLNLHLPALAELTPHAHVIHLYRRARGFATSHLRPSWSRDTTWERRLARRVRHEWNKRVFWTRHDYVPGMRRDDVIGGHPQSKFGLMLTDAGYDAERIMRAPTVVRLLAYWHYHYHYLEREGPQLFGERFTSVRYEDFATDPTATMVRLYDWIGLPLPEDLSFPEVHAPKSPFRPEDPRWREAARTAGFTDAEVETLL